jgi:integrase
MNAARRQHKRRDWPRGLREPRPGYYAWQHPDGRVLAIGRVPLAVAKAEANAANLHVEQAAPTLVERLQGKAQTMADLLDKMPTAENRNTANSNRSLDNIIRRELGTVACSVLTVAQCAELIESTAGDGRARTAEALRSRLMAVCRRGQALGWMASNPAAVTERPKVRVLRGRLTLETFLAIHAVAHQAAEWLPHAMMLALVTGQDRSTIAAMERSHVADGHLTVWRTKTRATNQPVAIPLALRLNAVGVSLDELVKRRTGVVSRYLVHHVNPWGNAPAGSAVFVDSFSKAFTKARELAKIPDEGAPTFHEIRSLSKRLYTAQGNVDTKALLGHATERMGELYADPRGVEPVRVRVG